MRERGVVEVRESWAKDQIVHEFIRDCPPTKKRLVKEKREQLIKMAKDINAMLSAIDRGE